MTHTAHALSGDQYEITAGPYTAVVVEQGGGLRSLAHDGRPLILTYGADELVPAAAGQLLVPWPNRVDHGRYDFDGETYQLPINEVGPDHAIHGLARWATWTLAEREPARVRLTHRLLGHSGYPFRLDLAVEYALDAEHGLTARLSACNTGSRPAPYGHGAHPYLTLGRPLGECELTIGAEHYLPIDERAVPGRVPHEVAGTPFDFRDGRPIGATRINNPYTGLRRDAEGRAWLRLSDGTRAVSLWADEAHPWLEVYTADEATGAMHRAGLGAEPMTCPPNAFVTGIDLTTLKPGAEAGGSWGIIAR